MDKAINVALRSAAYRLLRPLVRVLLHHGMAYGSFAELTRKAYVDESLDQLRRSGKRASISSVAAMSGLTRKEASRLADLDFAQSSESDQRYNRAVRVITAWTVDPRFLDDDGQPKTLAHTGDDSFETLVKDYSGDVPVAAMLTTLEASGTLGVSETAVELKDRAYLPKTTSADSLNILGTDVAELISSIDHNLNHEQGLRVFQRKVSNDSISASALMDFRALSRERSQALLEEYHHWLTAHEIATDDPDTDPDNNTVNNTDNDRHYVAVGIYYYDSTLDKESAS